jgi:hypothetical protein
MSHTSRINAVSIVDVNALRAACRELQEKQGVNLTLAENVTPRAFYRSQEGMGVAPFVVQLHDGPYDVGLYKAENGRGYEARCDLWGGHIAGQLGAKRGQGESVEQAALGKLFKLYAVHAAMRTAVANGHQVQRIDKENGEIKLVVSLAA